MTYDIENIQFSYPHILACDNQSRYSLEDAQKCGGIKLNTLYDVVIYGIHLFIFEMQVHCISYFFKMNLLNICMR
jgi:hypothetical protein